MLVLKVNIKFLVCQARPGQDFGEKLVPLIICRNVTLEIPHACSCYSCSQTIIHHGWETVEWTTYSVFVPCNCKICDVMFYWNVIYDIKVELLWDMIMPFQIPFVTKSVLLGGSNYQENKIVGKKRQKKICQRQIERLEQSTGIQIFLCPLSSFQTPSDHSQNFWRPSHALVSVLCSLVSCILPQLLSWLPLFPCVRHTVQPDWPAYIPAGRTRME